MTTLRCFKLYAVIVTLISCSILFDGQWRAYGAECNKEIMLGTDLIKKITNIFPSKNFCVCKHHTKCLTPNPQGIGFIQSRFGSSCKNATEVCCPVDCKISKKPGESRFSSGANLVKKSCGIRNSRPSIFFRSDKSSQVSLFGEFPWMVALLLREDGSQDKFKCGGSVVHENVVLTAAHCIYEIPRDQLVVRAGEWDPTNENEILNFQERAVDSVELHPNFYKPSLVNDVALLFLNQSFNMSYANVGTICLPTQDKKISDKNCFVSGWGQNVHQSDTAFSSVLKKVSLSIVPHQQCQDELRTTRLTEIFVLDSSFMCAGEDGADACYGDGGSPLVCQVEGASSQYYQAGIVSWGIECGQVPGVYANVSRVLDWIQNELTKRNLFL